MIEMGNSSSSQELVLIKLYTCGMLQQTVRTKVWVLYLKNQGVRKKPGGCSPKSVTSSLLQADRSCSRNLSALGRAESTGHELGGTHGDCLGICLGLTILLHVSRSWGFQRIPVQTSWPDFIELVICQNI